MPSVGKKESKILHAIARKRLRDFEDSAIVQEAKQSIEEIKPGPLARFTTEEELEEAIQKYISTQEERKKPLTITGLALALDIDRWTLLEYSKKEKFSHIVNKYRQVLLSSVEENLTNKSTFTPGQIFYLKNNYKQDYQDKIEVDNHHSGTVSLVELNRLASNIQEADIIDGDALESDTPTEDTALELASDALSKETLTGGTPPAEFLAG